MTTQTCFSKHSQYILFFAHPLDVLALLYIYLTDFNVPIVSPYLQAEAQETAQMICQGHDIFALCLLLTLLPKLKSLWIFDPSSELHALERFVIKVAKTAHRNGGENMGKPVLGQLRSVYVFQSYDGGPGLTYFYPFALLPTVLHLEAYGLFDTFDRADHPICEHNEQHEVCQSSVEIWPKAFNNLGASSPISIGPFACWRYPMGISNIKEISLKCGGISTTAILLFLPAFRNLRSFSYVVSKMKWYYNAEYRPVLEHVATTSKHTLKKLEFHFQDNQSFPAQDLGQILTEFARLRTFDLDVNMLSRDMTLTQCLPPSLETFKSVGNRQDFDFLDLKGILGKLSVEPLSKIRDLHFVTVDAGMTEFNIEFESSSGAGSSGVVSGQ